jgi:hypothetical protein
MSLKSELYKELGELEDANGRLRAAMASCEQELTETRLGRDEALARESDANAHNTALQESLERARLQRTDLRELLLAARTTISEQKRDNERLTLEGKLLLDRIQAVHTLTCPDCWPDGVMFTGLGPTGYETETGREVQQATPWSPCDRHTAEVRHAEFQSRILVMPFEPAPGQAEDGSIDDAETYFGEGTHLGLAEQAGKAFRDAANAEGMPQP